MARHFDQRAHEIALVGFRKHAASPAGGDRDAGERRKLAGERLGRGNADLRARERRHHHVAFAGDGRGRNVDHGQHVLLVLLGVAQRGERVRRLAGLRNEDREIARRKRRFAIAEFGSDIDLDRQPRKALEPVLRHQPCVERRAASGDRQFVELLPVERQIFGKPNALGRHVDVVRKGMSHDLGLLVDLLRHEVLVIALVDQRRRRRGLHRRRARPPHPFRRGSRRPCASSPPNRRRRDR